MVTQRPERTLDAPLMSFDIQTLVKQLKSEEQWKAGERNAITLSMGEGLRAEIVAMHKGTTIPSHHADYAISFQVIEGKVVFKTEQKSITLEKGQLLTLQSGIRHDVEAAEESVFLLTFGRGKSLSS